MKHVLYIFILLCFALSGVQALADIKMYHVQTMLAETESITTVSDKKIECSLTGVEKKELTLFYDGNNDYIQALYRIFQGSENIQSTSEQIRLLHKFISESLLKQYNNKQRTAEQVLTFQTLTQSSLFCRSAHLIFLLHKIVI